MEIGWPTEMLRDGGGGQKEGLSPSLPTILLGKNRSAGHHTRKAGYAHMSTKPALIGSWLNMANSEQLCYLIITWQKKRMINKFELLSSFPIFFSSLKPNQSIKVLSNLEGIIESRCADKVVWWKERGKKKALLWCRLMHKIQFFFLKSAWLEKISAVGQCVGRVKIKANAFHKQLCFHLWPREQYLLLDLESDCTSCLNSALTFSQD